MMLLYRFFTNPKVVEALKLIGMILLVILAISFVLAYLSVPVWILTHHVHHSAFTWWIVWSIYTVVGLAIIIGIAIAAEN